MSAAAEYRFDADDQIEHALIRLSQLPQDVVDQIHEAQLEHQMSFAEAALRLGHVSPSDIDSAHAGTRKLAVIEKRPLRPSPELVIAHDPFNDRSERVRVLRTELMLRHESGGRNAIAVMSPGSGEGRSRLAAELAIAFSQLGQATLLVDADLRRPRQHQLFNAESPLGLAQAIADGESPYLNPVEHLPHLSVLTAGAMSANPVELLSDGRLELLVDQWRRRYEHVVIDTSPVSEYSDALAVATLVARVLVVTRARHTPYKSTREMLRRLAATQSQVVGAVVNHF
ncbi:MAG: chain-length determining protein [Hydrocarboniphaga sp.]|uniref:CpsD/CapB family tyrosine-protein kinase n=1 Tax=Hydrocarboniphaga sp. TaxID=2033016 RepID=UPI00262FD6C0|nr:CpsD/CapB family tyrosine-protein kinase [Hydrocarboniphaga sp.]MDB5969098.1 chain-length determining protein [Hydrocarboniphaga sp.]